MTTISKFGHKVTVSIYNLDGTLAFSSLGLRADFKLKLIPGLNKAMFSLYNLNSDTIKLISGGSKIIKLSTQYHDQPVVNYPYEFKVNNVQTYRKLPDAITEIYCTGVYFSEVLSKNVKVSSKDSTIDGFLNEMVREITKTASDLIKSKGIKFNIIHMPDKLRYDKPLKPTRSDSGTVLEILRRLGDTSFKFNVYENVNSIDLVHKPEVVNQSASGQDDSEPYVFAASSLRANPKVGVAKMVIESVLDLSIIPGTIVDSSKLITTASSEGFDYLTLVADSIKNNVEGNPKFSTITVEHHGSNYTGDWITKIMAVRAYEGKKQSTNF